jgi:alkanesulfonate monooxygenase SsuD/methylene tetrahydromethanopterin reductase-like flavin-dependent oxidoreductase (luciferase family)
MRFAIAVNMQRADAATPMRRVIEEALDLVKAAEQGGFDIAWAAEHHGVELTVGPNPFLQLTHWAEHTHRIRLGPAVVVAPYWHPIRLAGEAGLFDLYSDGRLELGVGRGAFQYEFDRMGNGIPQVQGGDYLREMVPLLKALWAGDVEYRGKYWSFPKTTALPKPQQQPHPPIWVACRGPETFQWAVANGLEIMCTPLSKPFDEVEDLVRKYRETLAANPGIARPRLLVLRRTCVYDRPAQWREIAQTEYRYARRFAGLFQTSGTVVDGFPAALPDEDDATRDERLLQIQQAMMFGTPDEVTQRLRAYEALGFDYFCYGANFDLPHHQARRSLDLFIERVMPHFHERGEARAGTGGA